MENDSAKRKKHIQDRSGLVKSKCCQAEIDVQGRYSGSRLFEYCKKCHKRQDLIPTMRKKPNNILVNGVPQCPFCYKPMKEAYDSIAKKVTGYVWECKCMKGVVLSVG